MAEPALNPTTLLQAWRGGDRQALDRLLPLLYDELSRIAKGALSGERVDHTLQTRALVHEAYLRLIDAKVDWQDRAHFLALAARAMRRILTDHARSRGRDKRGANPIRVDLADVVAVSTGAPIEFLDLDEALTRLETQDERQARLIELHFYAGMNYEETAEALGISPATVGRELRLAKAWLGRELKGTAVMTSLLPADRWQRVKEIFDAAALLAPAGRAAFLTEICGDDETLRREVASLLEFDQGEHQALGDGILAALNTEASTLGAAQVIERIGPYRLGAEIGRGGMGAVYLAEREDDFSHRVAIKIVRGFMGPDALRRFRTERQILATLEHPSIARLLDGSTTAEGVPYLVMEYVEGVPIDAYCASQNLTVGERLQLFNRVCDAVSYAHRSLVVHRDLKASNILVTADGTPKLLDFGIAKLLDEDQADALQTTPSLRLLTPEYASPEQVRGQSITTATDIYSLGVLLFELLTGARPHRLQTRSTAEIELVVCEEPAPRPSTVVKRHAPLARQLTGDIDTIVLKALEKEPARRYQSVDQFSDDLSRHLDGHPVLARPATWRYRGSRFIRRHQAGVATAATVAVVILALGTALVLYAARATRERNTAQRMTSLLVELFSNSGQSGQGASMTVSELLDRGTERVKRELVAQPDLQAQVLDAIGSIYVDLGLPDRALDALRGSVAARQSAGALDSMAAARTMALLAESLRQRGQYAAAEPLARSALEMGRRLVGARNPQVAQWAMTLGQILHATGRREEAEALYAETTQIFRETLGPEHPMVAMGLSGTAAVRKDRGDLRGAESVARDSLAIVTRVFGLAMADRLTQVAEIVQASGRGDEAEALLRDAVAQRRRAFGAAGHPSLAPALEQLAAQLRANGKTSEAEALEHEASTLAR